MKHEYPEGPWEIRPVQAMELPQYLALNGIFSHGKLVATAGNYNHIGSQGPAALIADAPRLAEENERLTLALKSIAEMVVNDQTNHAELSALCIFVAKEAIEGRE